MGDNRFQMRKTRTGYHVLDLTSGICFPVRNRKEADAVKSAVSKVDGLRRKRKTRLALQPDALTHVITAIASGPLGEGAKLALKAYILARTANPQLISFAYTL